jgi:hypothetical protein
MRLETMRGAVERLLALKRITPELGEGPAIPEISRYLADRIAALETTRTARSAPARDFAELDAFFRAELARVAI